MLSDKNVIGLWKHRGNGMKTTQAIMLLNGAWLALAQEQFDDAVMQLIDVSGGDDWVRSRPHLRNLEITPSAWEGIVRNPDANLMPSRTSRYGNQEIRLSSEDIETLVSNAQEIEMMTCFRIYEMRDRDDVDRLLRNRELCLWGYFEAHGVHFILAAPNGIGRDELVMMESLGDLLGIRRPVKGDSDRGMYWAWLLNDNP